MKTLKIAQMVPLVLIAASSFAQGDNQAVPRAGGSTPAGGSSHHSSSGSGSSSSSSSGGGSSSASSGGGGQQSGGRYDSGVPDAARRRPRPGTGSGDRDRYGSSYQSSPYSSYYYDPYSYGWGYSRPYGAYGSYGYGLGLGYGYNDYGYSYGDYNGYYPSSSYRSYRYRSGNVSQVRTLVEPSKARVYVDGYYAGTVDDFDGLLQRLNVSPGRHEISFRLEGYKSHTFSVYANRDQTLKIRWDMAKGEGETRDSIGEENEREGDRDRERDMDRDDRRRGRDDRDRDDRDDRGVDSDRDRHDSSGEVDARPRLDAPSRMNGERGELLLDVQPSDASVYVDGEFYGKAGQVSRLDLPVGRHRVEVVRPGYKTEETEVTVDRDTKKVVVKLERR